ncbi:MAG: glycosyltransferase family 4 protein [Candidatus Falkowbacteria bacterium]
MKIFFIHNLYFPQERGGAEKYVRRLASEATAAGHQALIITTAEADRQWEVDGLPVFGLASDFAAIGDRPMLRRYVWQLANLRGKRRAEKLQQILAREQPDLVVTCNMIGLGMACLEIAAKYRHVHILHDVQLLYPSGLVQFGLERRVDAWIFKIYRAWLRPSLAKVKKVVSPSLWLLDWHRQRGLFAKAECKVLANPQPNLKAGVRPAIRADRPFRLLFVGQLEKHKGLKVLVEAYRLLDKQKFTLTIAGDGSLAKWLSEQTFEGLTVLGRQTSEEVSNLMSRSDCLIVPSLVWENAPLVLSEALACGLPAIGSDFGGIAEMIDDDELRFMPGDAISLADKIKRLARQTESSRQASRSNLASEPKAIWGATDYLKALLAFAFDVDK